jgi:hypothetical protein
MFSLFRHKKRIENLKIEIQDSFSSVKRDFGKVGEWITHIDDKHTSHSFEINSLKNQLLSIQNDLIELKDFISFFGPQLSKGLFKQTQKSNIKQTASTGVQTSVQTGVQTGILNNLTVMERALIWTMLNSDMKLSYEDIAALLGKDKSTIRGQINTIKQKNSELIKESLELNGKKRLFIPENIKSQIIKNIKVKIKGKNK